MLRLLLTSSLFICGNALAEDRIILQSGDIFAGEVIALSDGIISLKSPHSDTPLNVRSEGLSRLKFGATSIEELPKDSQVLNLRNGDSFPGKIVALSETHVSYVTWFAGQIEIPRDQIESLFYGVTPQTTIYRGPDSLTGWDQGNDSSWELNEHRLRSRDRGTIGKDFNLPENFIFSTKFSWANSPNLSIHFCSDSVNKSGDNGHDSYLMNINSQGIQIRRVVPNENGQVQYQTLVTYEAQLRDRREQSLEIELRVDRSSRKIMLTVDGEEVQPGYDPSEPPAGTFIVFESLSSGRRDAQLESIHLQEWDTKTQRFRAEPRDEEKSDTLTVDDGDRFSGKILNFDPESEQQLFVIQSPQSEQPISVPLANCSVMYFANSAEPQISNGEYQLDLRPGGSLTLSGITLGEQFLEANHPWLGKLSLDRRIMTSISKGKKQAP